jgi:hypothetical protein
MLFQLIYSSDAACDIDQEIDLIMAASTRNNPQQGITGLLVYSDDIFLQVLEGEEKTVQACYERIRQDPRHTDCDVVHSHAVSKRSFPKWAMAARRLPSDLESRQAVADIRSARDMDQLVRNTPLMLRQLFRVFGEFYFEVSPEVQTLRKAMP